MYIHNLWLLMYITFYGWGSTASRLEPLWGGSLLLSSQIYSVLILLTLEGWKTESTLEPPSGSEHGTPLNLESSILTTRLIYIYIYIYIDIYICMYVCIYLKYLLQMADTTYCATFHLKVIDAIKNKIVKCKD